MLLRPARCAAFSLALLASFGSGWAAAKDDRVEGYLDFRRPPFLIVDGQRVVVDARTRIHAEKTRYRTAENIPLGYHIKARGSRRPDGAFVARTLVATPNGTEFLEKKVLKASNKSEKEYRHIHAVADPLPGGYENVVGSLFETGPAVDRCRTVVDRLLPPYIDRSKVRVYVVESTDWNAMAMANYSIYVYTGLLKDVDDDELAIVLGHELAHATYEHSRLEAKEGLIGAIAGEVALIGASEMHHRVSRAAVEAVASLTVITVGNTFSRGYENQADRVGLRYAYEAGYDVSRAPALWKRVAAKGGEDLKVTNFFFGDHDLALERAAALQKEIDRNYSNPPPSETFAGR